VAIDLTVSLTDTEQAVVQAVALAEQPGATPAQIKAGAEKFCKQQLRAEVLRIKRQQDEDADRAAAAARIEADVTNFPRVT
jgi:Mg-chelatase subunit ChlI